VHEAVGGERRDLRRFHRGDGREVWLAVDRGELPDEVATAAEAEDGLPAALGDRGHLEAAGDHEDDPLAR